jgi:PKD repeat protein
MTKLRLRDALAGAILTVVLLGSLVTAQTPSGADEVAAAENWCHTQIIFEERAALDAALSPEACAQRGPCDDAGIRNSWIPGDSTSITYVRMVIHILRNDDGSNPISSDALVQQQVDRLNADFLQARIQFEYTIDYVNSSAWRVLSENEISELKAATAIKPDSQLNVWVTYVTYGYSFGTFPWDPASRSVYGGIVMGHFHWTGGPNSVFAHEVGHCLGLYHTFNGIEEVSPCGPCYEYPGASSRDYLGDRCSDTPPTPLYRYCSNAGGADSCYGQPFGYTQPENYMGYTPQSCYSLFTPQQRGRMNCWLDDELSTWVQGVRFVANTTFGALPLTVDFTGSSTKPANEWLWDFGDGETSSEANPTHTYTEAGYRTVGVTVQTPDGPYSQTRYGYISVYADTIFIDNISATAGQKLRVDINVRNFLPLKTLTIPLVWEGPFDLVYDSFSTAGLRTEYFEVQNLLNLDLSRSRITFYLKTSHNNTLIPLLEPGTGPVVSVFFTVPLFARSGSNPLALTSYNNYSPSLEALAGVYVPVTIDGSVTTGCCEGTVGNIDADPQEQVDIGDLTSLINFLYIGTTLPDCLGEANVDGDTAGRVDIGDLTALIDYLYISELALPACQ